MDHILDLHGSASASVLFLLLLSGSKDVTIIEPSWRIQEAMQEDIIWSPRWSNFMVQGHAFNVMLMTRKFGGIPLEYEHSSTR